VSNNEVCVRQDLHTIGAH